MFILSLAHSVNHALTSEKENVNHNSPFMLVVTAGHEFIQTSLLASVTSSIIMFDILNNKLSEFEVVVAVVVAVVVVVVVFTVVQLLRMFDGALTMFIALL